MRNTSLQDSGCRAASPVVDRQRAAREKGFVVKGISSMDLATTVAATSEIGYKLPYTQ